MTTPDSQPIKIVLGAGGIGDSSDPIVDHSTPEAAQDFLNIFRKHGYTDIDTARGYPPHAPGTCEPILGQTDISTWARIDTKVLSHAGQHTPDNILASLCTSLSALKLPSVNTLFLHWPDRTSPLLPVLRKITHLHAGGFITHFGLSNYEAAEVDLIVSLCDRHKLLRPTVYQVQYNAVVRSAETHLIPTLRRHGIRVDAWSPAASGFFGSQRRHKSDTRLGAFVRAQYAKPGLEKYLAQIQEIAEREGVTGHGIAIRWLLHHSMLDGSKGDGIVIGARNAEQLEGTLKICKEGPLPDDVRDLVERCWEEIKDEAPHFSPHAPKDGEVLRK